MRDTNGAKIHLHFNWTVVCCVLVLHTTALAQRYKNHNRQFSLYICLHESNKVLWYTILHKYTLYCILLFSKSFVNKNKDNGIVINFFISNWRTLVRHFWQYWLQNFDEMKNTHFVSWKKNWKKIKNTHFVSWKYLDQNWGIIKMLITPGHY